MANKMKQKTEIAHRILQNETKVGVKRTNQKEGGAGDPKGLQTPASLVPPVGQLISQKPC